MPKKSGSDNDNLELNLTGDVKESSSETSTNSTNTTTLSQLDDY